MRRKKMTRADFSLMLADSSFRELHHRATQAIFRIEGLIGSEAENDTELKNLKRAVDDAKYIMDRNYILNKGY